MRTRSEAPPPPPAGEVPATSERAIAEEGYVSVEQDRGINYYTPAVDRESVEHAAAEDFVENIFAGEAANLEILDQVSRSGPPRGLVGGRRTNSGRCAGRSWRAASLGAAGAARPKYAGQAWSQATRHRSPDGSPPTAGRRFCERLRPGELLRSG